MRAWIALLLITPALLGCLGADEQPVSPTNDTPEPPTLPSTVALYDASGEPVELPNGTLEGIGETVTNLTGFQGAEPTMGITESGAVFATAGDHMIRSTDGGASWASVYEIGHEAEPTGLYGSWDPWMHVDPVTDTVYMDPMFPPLACTELSWSTDDGETWTTNPAVCHPPPMDHQKLFTARPGPQAPPQAGVAHETVLFQCYNQLFATECAASYDGGLTWPVTRPATESLTGPCGGINGPGAGSPDGVVVLPITGGCEELTLAYSTDSGLTWQLMEPPGDSGLSSIDPEVMFDDAGNLFVIWRGDGYDMHLARTPDLGETWAGPWTISPPGVETTIFHALSTGANGTVAMSFYGTAESGEDPNDVPEGTIWNLYTVSTRDGLAEEPTFTSYQVTSDDDPVQVGRVCTQGIACDGGRNLLEFIDTAIAPDGTLYTIYTDGCAGDCADDPNGTDQSDAREIAWARLDGVDLLQPAPAPVAANVTDTEANATDDRASQTLVLADPAEGAEATG